MISEGRRIRWFVGRVLLVGLGLVVPAAALAQPLDPVQCERLQAERDVLQKSGVEADMARGPDWARANLGKDRLAAIGKLIEIDEQLGFRCGLAKQRTNLPVTVEGGEELIGPPPGEDAKEGAGPAAPAAAASKPVQKSAPAAAKASPPSPRPLPGNAAAPRPDAEKPRPAKRPTAPKADDAYRPPPRPAVPQ